jgi:hypothetical protein
VVSYKRCQTENYVIVHVEVLGVIYVADIILVVVVEVKLLRRENISPCG